MSSDLDGDIYKNISNQVALESRIIALYGSKTDLIQPLDTDYLSIPSDINNLIVASKVELGKL
jgi:cytochrome c peroxidase